MLRRDQKRHQDYIDEVVNKKKAWELEVERSISKYRTRMDVSQIPEVLSSTGTAFQVMSPHAAGSGPFKKTPLFGSKKQSEDLTRFEWPISKDLMKMSLDETTEYKVYKFSYKESFGCLKAIGLSITNDLETPVFNAGRNDRSPVQEEFLDVAKPVSKIRVRVF